jgi:outer membrane protein TolC
VRDEERVLKRLLNHPDLDVGSPTIVNTATEPTAMPYRLDPHELARAAMSGRMELLEEELRIAQATATVRVARNDLLPLLSLEYTYNIGGLGATLDDSLSQVREKRFEDHRVGVRLEVPIGNEAARSRLERAILSRLQRLATRDQRELQIRQEVYDAVDELDANWQRILAARRRVIAAARVVDLETRQNERGLRTSTDVLDAQANLASAKLSEIQAVTNYQIAQVDIAFATGTVLGASKVVWQPTTAPAH